MGSVGRREGRRSRYSQVQKKLAKQRGHAEGREGRKRGREWEREGGWWTREGRRKEERGSF